MPRTIGLMSGTSLDGVDAALLSTDGVEVDGFGPRLTLPYKPALRATLRALLDRAPGLAADDPALLDATEAMTRHHAAAVAALFGVAGKVERFEREMARLRSQGAGRM